MFQMPLGASDLNYGMAAPMVVGSTPIVPQALPSGLGTAAGAVPNFNGAGAMGGQGLSGIQMGGLALSGLQTLGNLWMGFQANKLAKQQLNFQKDAFSANFANSVSGYNTALEDRIRSRAVTEGRPEGYADSYLDKHKLQERDF